MSAANEKWRRWLQEPVAEWCTFSLSKITFLLTETKGFLKPPAIWNIYRKEWISLYKVCYLYRYVYGMLHPLTVQHVHTACLATLLTLLAVLSFRPGCLKHDVCLLKQMLSFLHLYTAIPVSLIINLSLLCQLLSFRGRQGLPYRDHSLTKLKLSVARKVLIPGFKRNSYQPVKAERHDDHHLG